VPNEAVFTFGAVLILLAALLLRRGLILRRVIRTMHSLRTTPLTGIRTGLVRTRGRLATDEPLTAPLTGRPAVYYFVKAEDVPDAGKPTRRLATTKQWTTTRLEDGQTRVQLERWTPLVASAHLDTHRFDDLSKVPPDRQALFEELGMADRHAARLATIQVTEFRFEPGDQAYVTGTYDANKGIYRHGRNPFIVSTEEDVGYATGLRHELLLYTAVPAMLLAAGLIVLVFSFA
jgi:hypothetical protein